MKLSITSFLLVMALWMSFCSSDVKNATLNPEDETESSETTEGKATVTDVSVSGADNQYTFSVTISSPDLGCNQYADWWEVIDIDGNLIYRRILAHSHVDEQPFTRSGGPVSISENTEVYIRAHMNTTSYGTVVFKGSIATGFASQNLEADFAQNVEENDPLPEGCAF